MLLYDNKAKEKPACAATLMVNEREQEDAFIISTRFGYLFND